METNYNKLLYEKMQAENETFKDWLLSQEPAEILNHAYEYTIYQDMMLCMEDMDLSPKQAKAMYQSPGSAAKNVAILLASVLKQEATQANKTRGKARLTNMIKSGKELKVFSIPNKDLKKFTEQAKRYGVLYCVLRDKNTKGDNVPIDIIARAEDASKIQRIVERFELGKVDKAAIVTESQKAVEKREALEKEKPAKSKNEIIMEEAVRKPLQKEENAQANPSVAKTDKNPPLRQNSEPEDMRTDKGVAVNEQKKPSVKEKLDHYKAQAKQEKEADRKETEVAQTKRKSAPKQTVHKQPKSKQKKSKER